MNNRENCCTAEFALRSSADSNFTMGKYVSAGLGGKAKYSTVGKNLKLQR